MTATDTIRTIIIYKPTKIPAEKSFPMETLPVVPYMIRPTPGGIVAVISEVNVRTFTENPLEYPLFIMSGPRSRASMAASAVAEPDTPPIRVLKTTLV